MLMSAKPCVCREGGRGRGGEPTHYYYCQGGGVVCWGRGCTAEQRLEGSGCVDGWLGAGSYRQRQGCKQKAGCRQEPSALRQAPQAVTCAAAGRLQATHLVGHQADRCLAQALRQGDIGRQLLEHLGRDHGGVDGSGGQAARQGIDHSLHHL